VLVEEVDDEIYYAAIDTENHYGLYLTMESNLVVFTYDPSIENKSKVITGKT
jgi:hypothetical protein